MYVLGVAGYGPRSELSHLSELLEGKQRRGWEWGRRRKGRLSRQRPPNKNSKYATGCVYLNDVCLSSCLSLLSRLSLWWINVSNIRHKIAMFLIKKYVTRNKLNAIVYCELLCLIGFTYFCYTVRLLLDDSWLMILQIHNIYSSLLTLNIIPEKLNPRENLEFFWIFGIDLKPCRRWHDHTAACFEPNWTLKY